MYYHIFVTGCQYNYYDSQNIAHQLESMGYVYVSDDKKTNLIIVLACSVRQKAVDRIYGKLKVWGKLPQKPKIIITGCLLPTDKKKLSNKVEAIIDTDKIKKQLPKVVKSQTSKSYKLKAKSCDLQFFPTDAQKNAAYIPIMQGCDNFCTYCAVPYTRGRERSRPMKEIVSEIKSTIKEGKKHILLLGQNVNSYSPSRHSRLETTALQIGNPSDSGPQVVEQSSLRGRQVRMTILDSRVRENDNFVNLLKKIDQLPGDFDFNFLSSNPHDFSDELIETLAKLKKWEKVLHLPLQSGDDQILKAMNRKYSTKRYLSLIENCKLKIVNLKLTTDIIVGFPGETRNQFQNTVNLCKKIEFQKAYVSQYSPRPGTPAAKMKDSVPRLEKKRRWEILNDLINEK